jgi:ferredoxin
VVLLALVPVLMLAFGWICALGSGIAARSSIPTSPWPNFTCASRSNPQRSPPSMHSLTPAPNATPKPLLAQAITPAANSTGGWIFGAFAGLVIGARLARFSIQPRRTDFEPDRGACVACARCFEYCPQERVRLGTWPAGTPLPGIGSSRKVG